MRCLLNSNLKKLLKQHFLLTINLLNVKKSTINEVNEVNRPNRLIFFNATFHSLNVLFNQTRTTFGIT